MYVIICTDLNRNSYVEVVGPVDTHNQAVVVRAKLQMRHDWMVCEIKRLIAASNVE